MEVRSQVSGLRCQENSSHSRLHKDTLRLLHFCGFRCEDHRMAGKKRKKKTFTASKTVREMARERVGSPKPSQLVVAKKSKPEKYKPTLGKLLTDE